MTDVAAPDVVEVLLVHHAVIEEQFRTVLATTGKAAKRTAFEDLARLLTIHETIEQELVHPAAAELIDTGPEVVADRIEEEQRADEVLAELFELEVNDPDFDRGLAVLRDAVLSHATREERYEFPRLRRAGGTDELAARVQAAFTAAPAELPRTDGGPTAALEAIRAHVREALTNEPA